MKYTRTIDNITGKEAHGSNRLFLEKIFGVRTAVMLPLAQHLHSDAALSLMFDGRLETDDYFLEFGAGFLLPSHEQSASLAALMLQFGASYYLTHSSVSPYIGAGVSPRAMLGDYAGAAFTVNAQLGLMFMRSRPPACTSSCASIRTCSRSNPCRGTASILSHRVQLGRGHRLVIPAVSHVGTPKHLTAASRTSSFVRLASSDIRDALVGRL
jgi:hypothetical protein